MIHWEWSEYSQLTLDKLYALLQLREQVFALEQQCVYRDIDDVDKHATHLLGWQDDKLVAYLRVFYEDKFIIVGRFVVAKSVRQQGLGKQMVLQVREHFQRNQISTPIKIIAQLWLRPFYESLGFVAQGEPYDDAGIMHVDMVRPINA